MSKNTFLPSFVTYVGYGNLTVQTLGGQNDTFQITGTQSEFEPNHRSIYCNYSFLFFFYLSHTSWLIA